ncbi:YidC/Oxa1 family membrane protein insertase [Bacillus cereus]|uniref:YidC/Oxa1 family membrane protein insertase n=1 Tax=Bacillus cereus TaxID=1396 RepID=UPI002DBD12BC|nr:YidC/Oxa1 family membrane protein insertase [Bacillus cereus]
MEKIIYFFSFVSDILDSFFLYSLNFFASIAFGNYLIAIILSSLLLKIITTPFRVVSLVNIAKKEKVSIELREFSELKDKERDKKEKRKLLKLYRKKRKLLYKSYKVKGLFFVLIIFFIQLPLIISFIKNLHVMEELNDLKYFWFSLDKIDPFFIFPIFYFIFTMFDNLFIKRYKSKFMLIFNICIAILIFIVSLSVHSSILIYWIISTVYTFSLDYYLNNFIDNKFPDLDKKVRGIEYIYSLLNYFKRIWKKLRNKKTFYSGISEISIESKKSEKTIDNKKKKSYIL